jgi:hypothetical protein
MSDLVVAFIVIAMLYSYIINLVVYITNNVLFSFELIGVLVPPLGSLFGLFWLMS